MIDRDEIEAKGLEFGIHVADVQRDYVFGWFLAGVYTATALKEKKLTPRLAFSIRDDTGKLRARRVAAEMETYDLKARVDLEVDSGLKIVGFHFGGDPPCPQLSSVIADGKSEAGCQLFLRLNQRYMAEIRDLLLLSEHEFLDGLLLRFIKNVTQTGLARRIEDQIGEAVPANNKTSGFVRTY